MKIHVAQYQPGRTGGGWTFADSFVKGMSDLIADYNEADIYFVASPSMVQRAEVEQAKADGKKIVLRLDNAVRNSRNRNTGMSRMKDFCDWADVVIYQSNWAKDYLMPFTGVDGAVILNGIDTEIFRPARSLAADITRVLYSRFNRDETKNYEVARYWFSQYAQENPGANLSIVGQFSEDLRNGNFDFYNGEDYRYFGVLNIYAMADLYRNCGSFLYTYFNDACSNSLIEALCSGCKIVGDSYYRKTGGADQIIKAFQEKGTEYFSYERMCHDYRYVMGGA